MTFNYQQVTRHFGHLFPIHIEALCELLIVLRQQLQGDLDLMLILAIISSRAMPARQGQIHTSQLLLNQRLLSAAH